MARLVKRFECVVLASNSDDFTVIIWVVGNEHSENKLLNHFFFLYTHWGLSECFLNG